MGRLFYFLQPDSFAGRYLDSSQSRYPRQNLPVTASLDLYDYVSLRGGVGAFSPLEVSQMRFYADSAAAGFEHLDAQHMVREPGSGA